MNFSAPSDAPPVAGRRLLFVGRWGVARRQAQQLVRQHGGVPVDRPEGPLDAIVIGADEGPLAGDELIPEPLRPAVAAGQLEVLGETQLWELLGLVDGGQTSRRLYTPAMLAELLAVDVATIRRWHRRGLIRPVREVHRLPYFDFQEIATARRLAQLLAAGMSPAAIERKLEALSRLVPNVDRPFAQLSVIIEGKQLLLRQGEGLIEPGGQMRFDFEALDIEATDADRPATLSLLPESSAALPPAETLARQAGDLEDRGEEEAAIEAYRLVLAAGGPNAEVCFRMAELLYRIGDVTAARERYYNAIELDEGFVEARANLGCVLAETGQPELAVAAFRGALAFHDDYPDVHYHLARTLDDLGRSEEAAEHWRTFVALAPDSPWAEEAHGRLERA